MRPVVKLFLNRELRQARRAGDEEREGLLRQVLADNDLFELVSEAAQAEFDYDNDVNRRTISGAPGDAFASFLQFLFANREQIFKIILQLVQILAIL